MTGANNMKNRFAIHIRTTFPYLQKSKLLIAVSGGVDSVVLAYLCNELGLKTALAHCNFQLRGAESDEDEAFVRNLGKQFKISVFVKHFNTRELAGEENSIQLVARDLRYHWFQTLREQEGFDYVLTAHHLNDDIETFFINLMRGTGIEGVSGIPQKNGRCIRPLLNFSRREIMNFALQRNLQWREDRSNASDAYLRNRIRHKIIPLFRDEDPQFLKQFKMSRDYLRQAAHLLDDYTEELERDIRCKRKGMYYYDISKIRSKKHPRAVLYRLFQSYGFNAWDDIFDLLTAQSGKVVFSSTHRLLKDREYLILDQKRTVALTCRELRENQKRLQFEGGFLICENVIKVTETAKNIAYLAAEKLVFPLTLRRWKSGDSFRPLGMLGRKKISDFLRDEKVSLFEKEQIWVLMSGSAIVWVVGHRIDDRFKIQEDTKQILKIEWLV